MDLAAFDPATLAALAIILLIGGTIKGVLGIGLPLFTVPLLATFVPLPVAITLLSVPVLSSNVWQAIQERRHIPPLGRFRWLLLPLMVTNVLAAFFLTEIDAATSSLILGVIVIVFSISQIAAPRFEVTPGAQRWLNPAVGIAAGLVGGVSSLYGPVLVMYLVALRLPRDVFVATIATMFVLAGIGLYTVLVLRGVITGELALLSALAAVPVLLGTTLGRRLRLRTRPEVFQRLLIAVLVLIGLNLIRKGLA